MWTHFMDMHSGGSCKEEPYNHIFIEAPEEEAVVIFYNRFDHNPNRISCTCCGQDYSISEYPTLEQATAYERALRYAQPPKLADGRYENARPHYLEPGEAMPDGFNLGLGSRDGEGITMNEYLVGGAAYQGSNRRGELPLVILLADILDSERLGDVPEQGWIHVG